MYNERNRIMFCTCPHCIQLLSTGELHPLIRSISRITSSELFKCDYCNTYLLNECGQWEIIQPPQSTSLQPSNAIRHHCPRLLS